MPGLGGLGVFQGPLFGEEKDVSVFGVALAGVVVGVAERKGRNWIVAIPPCVILQGEDLVLSNTCKKFRLTINPYAAYG